MRNQTPAQNKMRQLHRPVIIAVRTQLGGTKEPGEEVRQGQVRLLLSEEDERRVERALSNGDPIVDLRR